MTSPTDQPGPGLPPGGRPPRERALNVPGMLVALIAVLAAVHAVVELAPRQLAADLFINLAFFPARLLASDLVQAEFFAGPRWLVWGTFVSYGLLHGDWLHLGINALWLVTFGAPVFRRLGTGRFLVLLAAGTAAGAAMHLLVHWGSTAPLVGASAGVSAIMGGACRFVFDPRDRGMFLAVRHPDLVRRRPLQPLRELWSNPTVLVFVGMVLVSNLLVGAVSVPGLAEGSTVAWQAHIGGFAAGFFLFPLVDGRPAPAG